MNAPSGEPAPSRRFSLKRCLILVALLGFELIAVYSLRSRGWVETASSLQLIAALAVVTAPAIAAVVVLLFRGRRFSLRAMLIATTLMATFIAMVAFPFTQVRGRRRAVMRLEERKIPYRTRSQLQRICERFDLDYARESATDSDESDDIAIWMKPILGDSFPTATDRSVRILELDTNAIVEEALAFVPLLPNLDEIFLTRPHLAQDSLQFVADKYPPIDSLRFSVVQFPDRWPKFKETRFLSISGLSRAPKPIAITDSQLAAVLSTPNLKSLEFNHVDINDQNAALFDKATGLVHLTLWLTNITPSGLEKIRSFHPDLHMTFGPDLLSPERFEFAINEFKDASLQITYNQDRAVWKCERTGNASQLQYTGDGSAVINPYFPVVFECHDTGTVEDNFVFKQLRILRTVSQRAGLVETSVQQSETSVTMSFIIPWVN